jgi:hypothetical protein
MRGYSMKLLAADVQPVLSERSRTLHFSPEVNFPLIQEEKKSFFWWYWGLNSGIHTC